MAVLMSVPAQCRQSTMLLCPGRSAYTSVTGSLSWERKDEGDLFSPHLLPELQACSPGAAAAKVLQGHEKAHTMVALMEVYQEEDEAYQEFVTVATMFFQYLLQPFRDMRELATSCKLAILKSLDEDDLGPKRIAALQKEAQEWTRRAEEAVVSIQHITVNYFEETVKALADKQDEVVYYDPCESPEELKAVDHVLGLQDDKSLEVKELSRRCQQLESKRGRICARRAYLRNRKSRAPPRRAQAPALSPPRAPVNEHILAAIRQGVKLKKVHPDVGRSSSNKATSDLEKSIKAALQRIKRVSADSEEEEGEDDGNEQNPGEWDH
ncbi:hypothetical protein CB1_001815047 [Camelus ferus]|nr:hypothetical protein CB1_001815047 [Camelus ferus]